MTFMKVLYTLYFANGKAISETRQHLETRDYSEVQWLATAYLEENQQPIECVRVTATKYGAVVADIRKPNQEKTVSNNIIIAGGRDFHDKTLMINRIQELEKQGLISSTSTLICGMARGADLMARDIFKDAGLAVRDMPAEWDKLGKRAGYVRNEAMALIADLALVFWDGQSKGSKHMIETMDELKKPVYVVRYTADEVPHQEYNL